MGKKWDEPWRKKEPGGRLTEKRKLLQTKSQLERLQMKARATQIVKIVFHKKLWGVPGHFYGVSLEFKHPLGAQEIRRRIHMAFPELANKWEEERVE